MQLYSVFYTVYLFNVVTPAIRSNWECTVYPVPVYLDVAKIVTVVCCCILYHYHHLSVSISLSLFLYKEAF